MINDRPALGRYHCYLYELGRQIKRKNPIEHDIGEEPLTLALLGELENVLLDRVIDHGVHLVPKALVANAVLFEIKVLLPSDKLKEARHPAPAVRLSTALGEAVAAGWIASLDDNTWAEVERHSPFAPESIVIPNLTYDAEIRTTRVRNFKINIHEVLSAHD